MAAGGDTPAKNTKTSIEPYRGVLTDYDFTDRLKRDLEAELHNSETFRSSTVSAVRQTGTDGEKAPVAESNSNSALVMDTQYMLTADFTAVYVYCVATLLSNQSGKWTAVYRRIHSFARGVPEGEGDMEARWTSDNGAGLRRALDANIRDLSTSILKALDQPSSITEIK